MIREYKNEDLPQMIAIWNEVVTDGIAFPQTDLLTQQTAQDFFAEQSFTGVLETDGEIVGLYILHPNNVGRCGHIANASYAVGSSCRGQKAGQRLVEHSLEKARSLGFRIMQFNAVVAGNTPALHIYRKLGFHQLGTIPGGFLMKDGTYSDIILHYIALK